MSEPRYYRLFVLGGLFKNSETGSWNMLVGYNPSESGYIVELSQKNYDLLMNVNPDYAVSEKNLFKYKSLFDLGVIIRGVDGEDAAQLKPRMVLREDYEDYDEDERTLFVKFSNGQIVAMSDPQYVIFKLANESATMGGAVVKAIREFRKHEKEGVAQVEREQGMSFARYMFLQACELMGELTLKGAVSFEPPLE